MDIELLFMKCSRTKMGDCSIFRNKRFECNCKENPKLYPKFHCMNSYFYNSLTRMENLITQEFDVD